jgi:hypothetical protein
MSSVNAKSVTKCPGLNTAMVMSATSVCHDKYDDSCHRSCNLDVDCVFIVDHNKMTEKPCAKCKWDGCQCHELYLSKDNTCDFFEPSLEFFAA